MEPRYRLRLYLLTALILVGFVSLLVRLHEFQIERQEKFQALVPGNRTVTVREPGIRGEITDRNEIPLAQNLGRFVISFNLDEISKAYHSQNPPDFLPISKKEKDIVNIVNTWTIKPLKELGLAKNYSAAALRTHYITHGGLVPFTYRADLSYDELAKLAERNFDFPGVTIGMSPHRQYPLGALGSHVIGYLKKWEKGDISEEAKQNFTHYIGEDRGIAGIEATMDEYLRGPEGKKTILKDEKGRNIGMLDYIRPGTGAKVQLTLDAKIQFLLENTLRRAGRAAGVVIDVKTGEILAMASVPNYDPNAFIPSISREKFHQYRSNPRLSPFTNRAISAFEPGSTMKIPTALTGSIHGLTNRVFSCEGFVPFGDRKIGCWIWNKHKGMHGPLRLAEAIKVSCNPYFIKMATTMGWKSMAEGCSLLGFGKVTGIELPNEAAGILPGSREWRAARPDGVMTPALTAMMSIGQGDMLATPLQMAALTACIANGGNLLKPRLVKKVTAENDQILVADAPILVNDILKQGVKAEDLKIIREGMRKAVNEAGGTAAKVKMENIIIAAKTGTAQTTDNGQKSNNSWIISFAPFDQPKYAIVILVQAGGSGGAVCGPLIHTVYTGLFAQDQGINLPLEPQTEYLGHLDRIEAIEPLEDVLAAIRAPEISSGTTHPSQASLEETGETGEEATETLPSTTILSQKPTPLPNPTITQETDSEGQVIPRATPIQE